MRTFKEAQQMNNSLTVKDIRFKSFCPSIKGGNEGTFSDDLINATTADFIPQLTDVISEAQSVDEKIKVVTT